MAVRYSFECPECHASVELSTTQAGQEMSCSSCMATFSAPKLGDIKKLPVVGGTAEKSGKKRRSNSRSGSPVKGWLFAGGLLLLVINGIAGFLVYQYANRLQVDVDIEQIIAEELKQIDEAPPAEIYGIAAGSTKESFQLEYSETGYRTRNIRSGILSLIHI